MGEEGTESGKGQNKQGYQIFVHKFKWPVSILGPRVQYSTTRPFFIRPPGG